MAKSFVPLFDMFGKLSNQKSISNWIGSSIRNCTKTRSSQWSSTMMTRFKSTRNKRWRKSENLDADKLLASSLQSLDHVKKLEVLQGQFFSSFSAQHRSVSSRQVSMISKNHSVISCERRPMATVSWLPLMWRCFSRTCKRNAKNNNVQRSCLQTIVNFKVEQEDDLL